MKYDFGWIHDKAKEVKFGSFDIRIKVSNGNIVHVETIPGTEKEGRSLQETLRPSESD